ncbi:PilN domain-containing protein [Tatumella ptyseos]|uniref:PilN domain-containing protein n=1 Tax=Tatumella ptyseos TaxID=82987 RepID=UPI0026EF5EA4|nr:PilN domain-containing protein [Tatumella ptyseos]WKX26638.1 PilN domain-containing protein [Tatumella ptyseos]
MSCINLLDWRRKKLSQRSITIMATGIFLIMLFILGVCFSLNKLQHNFRELDKLPQLYQRLMIQLSERFDQQQQGLQQLASLERQRQQMKGVRDEMETYHFLFQWLTERLPEYLWLTTLTVGKTGWIMTGKSLSLEKIEQLIQELVNVDQVTKFSFNDLKREAWHYEFRVSFSVSAEVGGETINEK